MGKYYRGGKLRSADTFTFNGIRTLAGATAEQIWGGAATSRPSAGGVQVSVVSTSIEDDLLKSPITDVWDVTVGGAADAMDIARITINGAHFDYLVQPGDTTALIAAGLADAVNLGSIESWNITPGGSIDAADVFRITIDAVNYDYTVQPGDVLANVCTGLAAAVNGGPDPHYGATASGTAVLLTALARGVKPNASASVPTDPGADSTCTATALVSGIAADTNYTANDVASVVTLTNVITGATADTVASSYVVDAGAASTCTAVHTTTGANAVAGTGVRKVRVDYTNASGVRASEVISTNGTVAALSTATDVTEILAVTATEIGSSGGAVGTVSVKDGATVLEEVEVGDCAAYSAIGKVPTGQVGYVHQMSHAASVASRVNLCSDCNPATGAVVSGAKFIWLADQAGVQGRAHEFASPLGPFPAGAKIWVEAIGAAARVITTTVEGYYELA